jgi:hypothetical protein
VDEEDFVIDDGFMKYDGDTATSVALFQDEGKTKKMGTSFFRFVSRAKNTIDALLFVLRNKTT